MQRAVAKEQNVVMEGRDIGTVVLPDSTVKIFLTADADIRGFRRWREMKQKGQPEDFHKVLADLADRDYNDSHREVAPLKQADDAIMLDCTELSSRETTQALLEIVREIAGSDGQSKKDLAELLLCKSFAFVFGGRALRVATQTASPELFYTTLYRLVIASNRQIQDHSQSDGCLTNPA